MEENEDKVTVILERGKDGRYSAYIATENVPFGVIGEGKTVAEAIADFKNSVDEMREYHQACGKDFSEWAFEFKYDTASFLQQYAYAFTLAGLSRITGINQHQLSHYINGVRKPSAATVEKIERRLHEFAEDLAAVRFV